MSKKFFTGIILFFCVLSYNLTYSQNNSQLPSTTLVEFQSSESFKAVHKSTIQNVTFTIQPSNELIHIDSTNVHLFLPNSQTMERKPE